MGVTDAKGSGRTRQRYSDGDGDGDPAAREDPRRERATYQSLRPCCVRERRDETWERGPRESRAAIGFVASLVTAWVASVRSFATPSRSCSAVLVGSAAVALS